VVYAGSIFGDATHVIRETPAPRSAAITILPRAIDLGLVVAAGKNVGVRGLVDVTGTGTVAINGSSSEPVLDGTLTAVRGRAGFLNTRFQLASGALTFDPADGLLPIIDAQATTSTDTADITVSISGRVDHLHTDLQSNPEMSRDAILATLLRVPQINSALASSQGQPQSAFGTSPSNVVSGVVAGQLLGAFNVGLEQVLNLQEVDFSINAYGRPSLEVRKQVGPRVYSLYRTTFDVPPAQAFGLDYVIRRAIDVQLTQSQSTPGLNPILAPQQVALAVKISFH
jgi:autotransporter translocation and assembly factor TamB